MSMSLSLPPTRSHRRLDLVRPPRLLENEQVREVEVEDDARGEGKSAGRLAKDSAVSEAEADDDCLPLNHHSLLADVTATDPNSPPLPPRLLENGRGKEVEVEDDTRGAGRLNGDGTFGEVKADDDQQILCPPHRCHHRLHVAR
uniref:Uncharacterized protein n=1 Tax=Oryza rufipogon TaxID=4529 RepID=A0A0E0PC34_ORYRU